MNNIELIENKVAFRFLEDSSDQGFTQKTESGIIVQRDGQNQVKEARWGIVLKCAPSVTEVTTGDYILVEPLGWTTGMEFDQVDEEEFWMTTEDRIMAVTDTEPN